MGGRRCIGELPTEHLPLTVFYIQACGWQALEVNGLGTFLECSVAGRFEVFPGLLGAGKSLSMRGHGYHDLVD